MTLFSGNKKDYRKTAIIEIALIFCVLIIGDIALVLHIPNPGKFVSVMLLILEAIYLLLLLQLANHLNPSKTIDRIFKIAILLIFVLSLVALNPFIDIGLVKPPWLITIHVLFCLIECYLIGLGLRDIYSDSLHIAERLWGSVAIYLLIALGWGSFYEIILLSIPESLGTTIVPGYQSYAESLYQSLCSISGTGSVYTNSSHLMRNLSLIEAVWGVLFLVMLIGRLFSLPAGEKK